MAEESAGGPPKKLSTKEILAAARAASGKVATPAPAPAAPESVSQSVPAPEAVAPEATTSVTSVSAAAAKPAAGKPKSTADILAAARAAGAGGASGAAPAAPTPAAAAPKPAGAKPKSTADILAAARAAKGGAAPAAAASAEAPAAAKAPATAVSAPAASNLSVQEMLAAVRTPGAAPAVAEKKVEKASVAAPLPPKPAPAKKGAATTDDRRSILVAIFLTPFALAWVMLTAASAAALLGTARFMLPNVLTEPPRKFKIGPPTDYDLGTVATKWVAQYGVWIVHTDQYKAKNSIYALISVCTHLGCTPSWLEGEQKFKCPCHGSGFYITGINFEGPAPRPLERAGIRLAEDGMLEVDKSLKFQEEMGQWSDTNSFVAIA